MKIIAKLALAVALVTVGQAAAERTARADVPPPNMTCGDKKAGDACVDDDKKSGACTQTKCSRMGMSPGPNGTTERKIVEYDCMLCVAGSGTTAPSTTTSTPSPTAAPTTEKKSRGCSASGTQTASGGPADLSLAFFGALGVAALVRSRRRR
jgi:MYXO-CTERM domain-containing protein